MTSRAGASGARQTTATRSSTLLTVGDRDSFWSDDSATHPGHGWPPRRPSGDAVNAWLAERDGAPAAFAALLFGGGANAIAFGEPAIEFLEVREQEAVARAERELALRRVEIAADLRPRLVDAATVVGLQEAAARHELHEPRVGVVLDEHAH